MKIGVLVEDVMEWVVASFLFYFIIIFDLGYLENVNIIKDQLKLFS